MDQMAKGTFLLCAEIEAGSKAMVKLRRCAPGRQHRPLPPTRNATIFDGGTRRVYAAFNLLYDPEATRLRATGAWEHKSDFGVSAALTCQIRTDVFLGAEVRYLQTHSGLALASFAGHALFVGPTFYAKLSKKWWMAAAWNAQVAGHAPGQPGALDLTNFERHQARLSVGYNF
jgi:hypothetical protein